MPQPAEHSSLSPRAVRLLLFGLFALAFVLSPLWLAAATPGARILYMAVCLPLGAVWAWLAGGAPQGRAQTDWLLLAMLAALALLLNLTSLGQDIPWRGDEDAHIKNTLKMAHLLGPVGAAMLIGGAAIWSWGTVRHRRWAAYGGGLILVALVAAAFLNPFLDASSANIALRYPFVSYWPAALPPALLKYFGGLYWPWAYRLLPLAAAALLAYAVAKPLLPLGRAWALALGLAVLSLPNLWYYSAVFYLEMPAVLLATLVCLDAEGLLGEPWPRLRQRPAWYALVCLGFIKETIIFFLLCFLLVRGLRRLWAERAWRVVGQEALVWFCTLAPLGLYMVLRFMVQVSRGFSPDPANLIDAQVWSTLGLAYVEQHALWALLLPLGAWALWRRGQKAATAFLLLVVAMVPLAHAMDAPIYTGYSRFNLFMAPALLAASLAAMQWIAGKGKLWLGVALLAVLACNWWLTPVNWDGTRPPRWGSYLCDTGEHYYPYGRALSWLKQKDPQAGLLVTGMNYPYWLEFALGRADWHPRHQLEVLHHGRDLAGALAMAREQNLPWLLLQPRVGQKDPPLLEGMRLVHTFANQTHRLFLYQRVAGSGAK